MSSGPFNPSSNNTMQPTSPTPDEIAEISNLIAAANTVGGKAVEFSAERLKTCVAIGERFLQWKKQVGHGKWEAFANEHFPQLPSSTRTRWQKLAEAKRDGKLDLSIARGLLHAYKLAGIIPDAEPVEKDDDGKEEPVSYLIHIARTVAALGHIDLDALEPAQRELLKERLRPIVTVFYKINTEAV